MAYPKLIGLNCPRYKGTPARRVRFLAFLYRTVFSYFFPHLSHTLHYVSIYNHKSHSLHDEWHLWDSTLILYGSFPRAILRTTYERLVIATARIWIYTSLPRIAIYLRFAILSRESQTRATWPAVPIFYICFILCKASLSFGICK